MFPKVLVPLDGSTFAEFAVPVARALAMTGGGRIELLMVQDPVPPLGIGERLTTAEPWREEYLSNVEESIVEESGDLPVTSTLRVGVVSDELTAHVVAAGPDVVVMATHGRGPLSRAWVGSVADHQVRHSPCPVLLVRPEEESEPNLTSAVRFNHILIPLDGSKRAEAILEPALALGALFQARYTLVRVVHYPAEVVSSYMPDTIQVSQEVVAAGREEAKLYLNATAERLRARGLTIDVDVPVDVHPTSGIVQAAEDGGADLVALSTHGDSGVRRAVLGSVADKLIRSANFPILVHRPQVEEEGES